MKKAIVLIGGWCWLLASAAQAQNVTFTLAGTPNVEQNGAPICIVAADLNSDGKQDVITADYLTNTLSVLLGDGKGNFTLQPNSSTTDGLYPQRLVVADVNGDGHPDALTTNDVGTLAISLGDGTGSFKAQHGSPSTGGTGGSCFGLAVADVNNDGYLDALAANYADSTLGVLIGNGKGEFRLVATPSTGANSGPYSVTVADINGDGKPDALTANLSNSRLGILLGDGTGGFTVQNNLPSVGIGNPGPYAVAAADVNNDGRTDALTVNTYSSQLAVLLGDGQGGFTLQAHSHNTSNSFGGAYTLTIADVNADKNVDVLVVNRQTGTLGVLLNDGKGSFTLQENQPLLGSNNDSRSIAVADVNGDNKPDALVSDFQNSKVVILLNTTTALPTRAALPGTSATLYPNPARSSATLTLAGLPTAATQAQATLLDAVGRVVGRHTLAATGGSLPLAGLRPGLYVVQLAALDASGQVLGELPAQRLSVE